jgi:hypothetical protein
MQACCTLLLASCMKVLLSAVQAKRKQRQGLRGGLLVGAEAHHSCTRAGGA